MGSKRRQRERGREREGGGRKREGKRERERKTETERERERKYSKLYIIYMHKINEWVHTVLIANKCHKIDNLSTPTLINIT